MKKEVEAILNQIKELPESDRKLIIAEVEKIILAERIVAPQYSGPGWEDEGTHCGMAGCPFHSWIRITSSGAIDSYCNLPGGEGVIECAPFFSQRREGDNFNRYLKYNGKPQSEKKRLPKCLEIKPPKPLPEENK